jgi:rod shape-determining protein MreD
MTEYGDRYLVGNQREQVSRFRARVMFVVPLAAILFQVYVPRLDFLGFLVYLELPLLVTIYFALMRRSQIGGLFIGAFIGLAQDSLSIKQPLGMFGIVDTLVGYFAASVGLRIDVEHSVIRLLLTFFFYFFHQFLYWVLARGLLGRQIPFEIQRTLVLGLLNAIVGVTLFHFLDKLREPT